jgi:hypothetical protein
MLKTALRKSNSKINKGCNLIKINSKGLPNDAQITYSDGKIKIYDSIGNSIEFESNELTILHSKTIVVNLSAYIITTLNIKRLAGHRYYIVDNELKCEAIPADSDDESEEKSDNTREVADNSDDDNDDNNDNNDSDNMLDSEDSDSDNADETESFGSD